jgi:hypothetical protein
MIPPFNLPLSAAEPWSFITISLNSSTFLYMTVAEFRVFEGHQRENIAHLLLIDVS